MYTQKTYIHTYIHTFVHLHSKQICIHKITQLSLHIHIIVRAYTHKCYAIL